MVEQAFIAQDNTTKLICPQCGASKTENVSAYLNANKAVELTHKCRCGFLHTVLLERRQRLRKTVKLSGEYEGPLATDRLTTGPMIVKDISRAGLNFQINAEEKPDVVVGDRLLLTFHLDDNQKTLIRKEVSVRNIRGSHVGAEFRSVDLYDRALGRYMFIQN